MAKPHESPDEDLFDDVPDTPPPSRKESPKSKAPEAEDEVEVPDDEVVHHVSTRKKRKKGVGGEEMELQLTSMIDVIFQLLIYFVITANFMIDEGTIVATMPGSSGSGPPPVVIPYVIELDQRDNGTQYVLRAGGSELDSVGDLYATLKGRIDGNIMSPDDPVRIQPDPEVRWTHVVNVYNACIRAEVENISFAAQ